VHEQVVNKLSVQFADIGAQQVKNIPTPVHAYMVTMRRPDGSYAPPQVKKPAAKAALALNWMWPLAVMVVCVAAIGVGGFLYLTKLEMANRPKDPPPEKQAAATPASPATVPHTAASIAAATPAPTAAAPSPQAAGEKIAPANVPFISERARRDLASDYVRASGFKAFALNTNGFVGSSAGQPSEDVAKIVALDQCSRRAEAAQSPRKCEVYAVGDTVVYPHGPPPMPPVPWVRHDAAIQRPFVAKEIPLVRDQSRERLEKNYLPARKSKSIALAPGGQSFYYPGSDSIGESIRRALESCGAVAGVPCMIVAVDDVFVVTVPSVMKATGFFHAATSTSIAADARDDLARKLDEASTGWSAVAVGTSGRPGLGLKAASEQNAINDALGNCAKRDSDCHVIAIGPFLVGPN
jgi:adenylate cyclase